MLALLLLVVCIKIHFVEETVDLYFVVIIKA